MGETTEMILEGILCQQCGQYIDDEPVGYPRNCSSCEPKKNNMSSRYPQRGTTKGFEDLKRNLKKENRVSTGVHAVNGIINFITKKGLHKDDLGVVLSRYSSEELGVTSFPIEVTGLPSNEREEETIIAEAIQRDFGKFVTWFKKNYKN